MQSLSLSLSSRGHRQDMHHEIRYYKQSVSYFITGRRQYSVRACAVHGASVRWKQFNKFEKSENNDRWLCSNSIDMFSSAYVCVRRNNRNCLQCHQASPLVVCNRLLNTFPIPIPYFHWLAFYFDFQCEETATNTYSSFGLLMIIVLSISRVDFSRRYTYYGQK